MSYKPGFYEPKNEKGRSAGKSDQKSEEAKSSCPVKKFMTLGLIVMIGALIMKAVKEE